jgi:hypothetical protein
VRVNGRHGIETENPYCYQRSTHHADDLLTQTTAKSYRFLKWTRKGVRTEDLTGTEVSTKHNDNADEIISAQIVMSHRVEIANNFVWGHPVGVASKNDEWTIT